LTVNPCLRELLRTSLFHFTCQRTVGFR